MAYLEVVLVVISLAAAAIPAWIAERKGRRFARWYVFGFLLLPVAVVAALLVGDRRPPRCPECLGAVQAETRRCPHCQRDIAGRVVAPQTAAAGQG
jgi:hypothetical protein